MIENKIISAKKKLENLKIKEKKKAELKTINKEIKQIKRKNSIFSFIYSKIGMLEDD